MTSPYLLKPLRTEAEARAMTDQPAAAPTSKVLTCSICGNGGLASIGIGSKYEHDWTRCLSAERDRLVKMNEGLLKALEAAIDHIADLHSEVIESGLPLRREEQTVWNMARAVLDEARQS